PAGAAGVAIFVVDGTTAGDIALFDVLGAKGDSAEALANIEAGQGSFANLARAAANTATSALAGVTPNRGEYRSRLDLLEAGGQIVETTIGTAAPADAATLGATPTYLIDVPTTYAG